MAPVPKVRWRPQAFPQPGPVRAGAWRSAPPPAPTLGAPALTGGAQAFARELLRRDVWFASAGHVAVDALPSPSGRIAGIAVPSRRRRTRKAASPVQPKPRRPRKRGLPAPATRRLPVVGPARRGEKAPPLTALDLPNGVVSDWESPLVDVARPRPEPPPATEQRRVVRRVGLGAPLPAPPPRPAGTEESPGMTAPERPVLVRTFPRRRLERVPDDVRRAVESVTGVDLGDVAVNRD